MAYTSNYSFFSNMSRIGLDDCNKTQTDIQNVQFANHMLQNYYTGDCTMRNTVNLATTQPGIMYSGGYGSDFCGSNIDASSNLMIGSIQSHPKCRIDLFQRPFATVPYLGRGSVNPVIESQIQQGDMVVNKKSVNALSEKSFIKYSHTPLLASVHDRVSNPANSVEGVAQQGWVRGGVPSRDLTRDTEYYNNK